MKTDLAIIGQGSVSPAGIGVSALLGGAPVETLIPLISRPEKKWPVYKIDLKNQAFARWQSEPRLRRASPISFFLVEAAEQALAGMSNEDRAQTGLVVAFSTGCLAYSRRFFENIITQGPKTASPALFPETVFNSPVSHVASTLRLEGAAYALAGDETAWIAALKTATLWLEQQRVKQVLVLGSEEFDSASLDAYQNAGWLKSSYIPSEGAAAMLVRKKNSTESKTITQLEDGFIYTCKMRATLAAQRCLQCFDANLPSLGTAQRNWLGPIEEDTVASRNSRFPSEKHSYLGEASTASAAWNTLRGLALLDQELPRLLLPIWGMNHQIGAIEMEKHRGPVV